LNKRSRSDFKDTLSGAIASKRYQDQFKVWLKEQAIFSAKIRGSKDLTEADYKNGKEFLLTPRSKYKLSVKVILGKVLCIVGSVWLGIGLNSDFGGDYFFVASLLIIGGLALEEK